jgi:transcription elongation GreA/GreB family factor
MIEKKTVIEACYKMLQERSESLRKEIAEVRADANEETKSSAGDKYETSREMMGAHAERLINQLAETNGMRELLYKAEQASQSGIIGVGSLVSTDMATFFLAAPLGKMSIGQNDVYVISTASPIGKLLLGKSVNDRINFNGKTQLIQEISN